MFEQNILGLQVTMHNALLMAVVDAGEDLLHEYGAISFAELSTLEDFVEELATLADLRDQVIALVILEELVHFDDIGVILKTKHRYYKHFACI